MQAEVDDYIARFAAERDHDGRRLVVRNGSHQPREVLTSAGAVEVIAPRVNDRRGDRHDEGVRRIGGLLPVQQVDGGSRRGVEGELDEADDDPAEVELDAAALTSPSSRTTCAGSADVSGASDVGYPSSTCATGDSGTADGATSTVTARVGAVSAPPNRPMGRGSSGPYGSVGGWERASAPRCASIPEGDDNTLKLLVGEFI